MRPVGVNQSHAARPSRETIDPLQGVPLSEQTQLRNKCTRAFRQRS